jgi:hypothetical protein
MTFRDQADMMANLAFVEGVLASLPKYFSLDEQVVKCLNDALKKVEDTSDLLKKQATT